MTDVQHERLESRLRGMAKRQDMRLLKSRRRDPSAIDFGGYMLIDASTNAVVRGGGVFAFSASLEDIQDYFAT